MPSEVVKLSFLTQSMRKTHFETTAFKDIDYKIPHILQDITCRYSVVLTVKCLLM